MKKRNLALLLLCMMFITFSYGCHLPSKSEPMTKTGFYFDTVITITLYNCSEESLLDDCFSIAEKYEKMFSTTLPDSEISKINQAKGSPVTVSDETIALLKKGLEYCELSNGGFDITIGKLSSLWNFTDNEEGSLPDPDAIANAVSTVNYKNIHISENSVTLSNPETEIDLGGIAKGYIADQMKAYLNENGITSGTINLGGNVLCLGPKSDGSNYRIGIQKPFDTQGTAAAVVEVQGETVVSSGIYERYFERDGTIYHHILNPDTGYPYENQLLGVTIICPNSVDGDGLSTTCFSLGLEDGMDFIETLKDTEAVFITKDYKFHCSSGIGTSIPFEEIN